MAVRSRICPACGKLNGADEARCYHCGQRLPGPLWQAARELWTGLFGTDFPATKFFVAICLAVFAFSNFGLGTFDLAGRLPLSQTLRWGGLLSGIAFTDPAWPLEPWRWLSAIFLHYGLLHIVFNMGALWSFGAELERGAGSARFVLVFLLTGVLGFLTSDAWYALRGHLAPTAGASGGIFGLIGAEVGRLYAAKNPAYKQLLVRALVVALIMGLAFQANNAAHLGGLVSGVAAGWLLYKERRPERHHRALGAIAVALSVLSLVSILLSNRSITWQIVRQQEMSLAP